MLDNPFEENTTTQSNSPFSTPAPMNNNPFTSESNNPFGGGNNNFGNNGGGNRGNYNNGGVKRKYKFVQMYVLVNSKLFANLPLNGECAIMEITYNVDYGNLRLSFGNGKKETFDKTSIKLLNIDRITTVNVYPEVAEQILYNIDLEKGTWSDTQIHMFERMLQGNANWSPNQTIIKINGNDQTISIATQPSNGNTQSFTFSTWQVNALINSLKFLVNGTAWNLDMARFIVPSEQ